LGLLALFGSFLLLGRLFLRLLGLFGPLHQELDCGFVARFAAIFGEIRITGCLVDHLPPRL
jgi:hypothetical protein